MRAALALVLCSSFVSLAQGAVVTVKPAGPLATIQEGVDAAAAGDTVRVLAGVYSGPVVIPAGKVGLKLVCVGTVILDARDAAGDPVGRALVVAADGCLVRKLRVRHADEESQFNPGQGVVVTGDAVTLDTVTVRRCSNSGILITGQGSIVRKCIVRDSGQGIRVIGNDTLIEKCRIERVELHGIEVEADGVVIRKNVVRGASGDDAIFVDGDDAVIEQNDVRESPWNLISVQGTNASVRKNHCSGSHGRNGILWEGVEATIDDNIVTDVAWHGIDVLLVGGASLARNRVQRCGLYGIRASEEATTVVDIRDSVVRGAGSGGIDARMTFGAIDGNDVRECGRASDSAGIRVEGGSTYSDNLVRGCAGDGFRITADDVALTGNRAIDNAVDGFDVELGAANAVLDGNVAAKNLGEGLEINGPGATLQDNVCTKNRIDFATTANPLVFSGNVFATGGLATAPEIE